MGFLQLGKNKVSTLRVLIIDCAVLGLMVLVAVYGLSRYEKGIIDVCATQQDGYVKLVIDQINLRDNRTDREIIEGILNTLDSSSNRYWTFAKNQEMLYVKDTLETNRYKSLTAASYYDSPTAKVFLQGLVLNRVKHFMIELDGKDYIASGSLFEYNGSNYRICLLTNVSVLLDNNVFLGAKIELIMLLILAYSAMFIFPLVFFMMRNRFIDQAVVADEEKFKMGKSIENLNDRLAVDDIYDNRKNLFAFPISKVFIEKYKEERRAFPFSILCFRYGTYQTVSGFFGVNSVLFGKSDVKFYEGRQHLVMIFAVRCSEDKAKEIVARVSGQVETLSVMTCEVPEALENMYAKSLTAMGDPSVADTKWFGGRSDSRTEGRYRVKFKEDEDVDAKVVAEINARLDRLEAAKDNSNIVKEPAIYYEGVVTDGSIIIGRLKKLEQRLEKFIDIGRRLDYIEERMKRKNDE